MPNLYPISIMDISGGETSIFAPGTMDLSQSRLLQNLYVSRSGGKPSLSLVPGYKALNGSPVYSPLNNGFYYKNGEIENIFVSGQGKIFRQTGDVLSEVYSGWNTTSTARKIYFAQMMGKMVCANGEDICVYYDGDSFHGKTAFKLLNNFVPDKPFVHKGRMWYINAKNKMEAVHSALQDPLTMEGYLDFSTVLPQSDELIDIKGYMDFICFIFKNHIIIYSGTTPSGQDADFALYQIINLPGIISPDTDLNVANSLFIATTSGIKALQIVYPSSKVTVNNFSSNNEAEIVKVIQENANKEIGSIYCQKMNWLMFMFGDTVFCFNNIYGGWHRLKFPNDKAQITSFFSNTAGDTYLTTSGYLCKYGNDFLFNGQQQLPIWKTAWIQLHQYASVCFPKHCDLLVKAALPAQIEVQAEMFNTDFVAFDYAVGEFSLNLDIDKQTSKMDEAQFYPWENGFYMDSLSPNTIRVPLMNAGKFLSLCIIGRGALQGFQIDGLTVYAVAGRR
jgi:hypothetical protein